MSSSRSRRWLLWLNVLLLISAAACAPGARAPARPKTGLDRPSWPLELEGSKRVFALLVNADQEPRHERNIRDAKRALAARGVPHDQVVVVSPDTGAATAAALRRAIATVSGRMHADDGIVIYVTGHGSPEGVVLSDGVVLHADLVDWFEPFKEHRGVFVFDACHAGALPRQFTERGFRGLAIAPTAEGEVSHCQWFSPKLWSALEHRFDSDDDGGASFVDAFRLAIDAYNQRRRDNGLGVVDGAVSLPIVELRREAELSADAVIVALTAKWCGACEAQARQLAYLRVLLGANIAMYTVDVDENPLARRFAGNDVNALPIVVLLSKGQVRNRIVGAQPTLTLLSETSKAFGSSVVTANAARDQLVAKLESANRNEVRFAVKNLVWLLGRRTLEPAAENMVVQAFVAEIRLLEGRALRAFVEAVKLSGSMQPRSSRLTGHAALLQRLDAAEIAKLAAADRRYFARQIPGAVKKLESKEDGERARAWLTLWRLALDPAATLDAFAPWLWQVRRLAMSGDAEQRRIAGFVLSRIADLPDRKGVTPAPVQLRFEGAHDVAPSTLSRAVDNLIRKSNVRVDGVMAMATSLVQGQYNNLGYLDARVRLTGSGVTRSGHVELIMSVVEGPRYRWGTLEIRESGVTTNPIEDHAIIDSLITLPKNAFANKSQLSDGVTALIRHYRDAGFGAVTVTPKMARSPETRVCKPTILIKRGARMRIHDVRTTGGDAIPSHQLATALVVAKGAWFSMSALEATRKRLRALPDVRDASIRVATVPSMNAYDVHIELRTY